MRFAFVIRYRTLGIGHCLLLLLAACVSTGPEVVRFSGRVPQGTGLRIAVIGDQQRTSRYEIWRERKGAHADVVQQMLARRPDALVLLGDMVFDGSYDGDWAFFDGLMKPVAEAGVPVFPVYGNHEYLRSSRAAELNMRKRFASMRSTWYTVTMDSVAFVMINTNFDRISEAMCRQQRRWYDSTLVALEGDASVRCVVVCGHHPPFTNSMNVSDHRVLQSEYVPAFLRHSKSRLWLSGHSHALEHLRKEGRDFVVTGGGGAPRHKLMADDELRHPHVGRARKGRTISPFHFLIVQRRADSLRLKMIAVQKNVSGITK